MNLYFTNSRWTGGRRRSTRQGRLATGLSLLAAATMTIAACNQQRDPSTPEEAAKRGDELLRKEEPGQPVTQLVFSNWNLKPQLRDSQFAAQVPQGYELIPVVERIPKSELKADAAKAMGVPAN